MARSTPLVKQRANSKAGRFNTRRLRSVQSFAFKTGGCGLSSSGNRDLWELFFEWESDRPSEPAAPRRLRDFFPTPHALQQALSDDIDEAVQREEWFSCRLIALDESFEGYYRSVLGVVLGDFKAASKVRYWARGGEDEGPSDDRETPIDGDAFRLCEELVKRDHGPAAFVLGIHAYSDSCVISSSAAHKLYPVRVRVLNAITGEDEWYDIAYIPQVTTERGSAGAERSRQRRILVLQRILYLAFREFISASHTGVPVPGGEHGTLLAFPRLLLYICDQPEERAVLCFKPRMCYRPCSICDVLFKDLGTPAEMCAGERNALSLTMRQLEVHGDRVHGRGKQRRDHLERTLSINGQPPALAAIAGLGTPFFLLYKIVALDVLHVLDLGITRLLVHRLLRIFPSMSGDRPPLHGSFTATYVEAYRRLLDLGRRSKASRVRPGYLVKSDENQTSFTGRE
eukprot:contig_821_g82